MNFLDFQGGIDVFCASNWDDSSFVGFSSYDGVGLHKYKFINEFEWEIIKNIGRNIKKKIK